MNKRIKSLVRDIREAADELLATDNDTACLGLLARIEQAMLYIHQELGLEESDGQT